MILSINLNIFESLIGPTETEIGFKIMVLLPTNEIVM